MTTPHRWKNEIIAWLNGQQIEYHYHIMPKEGWRMYEGGPIAIFESSSYEFRIHDPHRELKEAKDRGLEIQVIHRGATNGPWIDEVNPDWALPPIRYRIKPREPLVRWIPEWNGGGLSFSHYPSPNQDGFESTVTRWIKMREVTGE